MGQAQKDYYVREKVLRQGIEMGRYIYIPLYGGTDNVIIKSSDIKHKLLNNRQPVIYIKFNILYKKTLVPITLMPKNNYKFIH